MSHVINIPNSCFMSCNAYSLKLFIVERTGRKIEHINGKTDRVIFKKTIMKKVLLGSVLLVALASCGSDGAEENTTHKGTGAGSPQMVDTSATSNQSGATGNGGIGTGASNQTGEENSGTGAEGGSGSAASGNGGAGKKAGN